MSRQVIQISQWFAVLTILFIVLQTRANASDSCVTYSEMDNKIVVSCPTYFRKIARQVHNEKALRYLGNSEWLLSADLEVTSGASLSIDGSDLSWLKMNSQLKLGSRLPIGIKSQGELTISGVKITSWNPTTQSVAYQKARGDVIRPYIRVSGGAKTWIEDSEIAHLGYHSAGMQGLCFDHGSKNITLRANYFHHLWYAFFSEGASDIKIYENEYSKNYLYGINAHSYTQGMEVSKNHFHYNQGFPLTASDYSSRLVFSRNTIHSNSEAAIMLGRFTHNSQAKENWIYDQKIGISISDSSQNEVSKNLIERVELGVLLQNPQSSKNSIFENRFEGVRFALSASILSSQDRNIFARNSLRDVRESALVLAGNSALEITEQKFKDFRVTADSSRNFLRISKSKKLTFDSQLFDTDLAPVEWELSGKNGVINSSSIRTSSLP